MIKWNNRRFLSTLVVLGILFGASCLKKQNLEEEDLGEAVPPEQVAVKDVARTNLCHLGVTVDARAGLAVAPANAHAEVKAVAHHVSQLKGGQGAARECCDLLLWATGRYEALLHGHLETLDTDVAAPGEARP